jgi:hypothetical protein
MSQWVGVHIGNFQEDGGNNLSSQEYSHMHNQFEMILEETKKILLEFTAKSFNNCT